MAADLPFTVSASDLKGNCDRLNRLLIHIVSQIPKASKSSQVKSTQAAASITTVTNVSSSGGGTGTVIYKEVNPSAPTTITPPAASAGVLLVYRIKQGAFAFQITWGAGVGALFFGPPPIPQFANTWSVVSFIGGSDNNWYIQSSVLGFTQ